MALFRIERRRAVASSITAYLDCTVDASSRISLPNIGIS
jgi:hypothetical protein